MSWKRKKLLLDQQEFVTTIVKSKKVSKNAYTSPRIPTKIHTFFFLFSRCSNLCTKNIWHRLSLNMIFDSEISFETKRTQFPYPLYTRHNEFIIWNQVTLAFLWKDIFYSLTKKNLLNSVMKNKRKGFCSDVLSRSVFPSFIITLQKVCSFQSCERKSLCVPRATISHAVCYDSHKQDKKHCHFAAHLMPHQTAQS